MKSISIGLVAMVVIAIIAGILQSTFSDSTADYYSGNNQSVRIDN